MPFSLTRAKFCCRELNFSPDGTPSLNKGYDSRLPSSLLSFQYEPNRLMKGYHTRTDLQERCDLHARCVCIPSLAAPQLPEGCIATQRNEEL